MYREIEESQTLLINSQSLALSKQNKKIIKFGFGQSPFLPQNNVLNALENAANRKEYSSVQGDLELRELIAHFHKKHNGLEATSENILIAPGSKILIYSILLAFLEADVFIPAPAWVSYAPQAKLIGHNAIRVKSTFEARWRVTPDELRNAAKNKQYTTTILILNYPGNPDGLTYSETELKALAEVARELDILVISDEIYGLLSYNSTHLSFANYYPEKTITTTGLSKWCGAGGWRLGVALLSSGIPELLKKTLIGIASETYSCAPTPVQIAAREAYRDFDGSRSYVNAQIEVLKRIGSYCATELNKNNVRVHAPEGGFYIFPDFTLHKYKLNKAGIFTSNQLCEQLLATTGVALLPATAFGFEPELLAARLAFVDFEEENAKNAASIEQDFPKVVEGIRLIIAWLKGI